MHVSFWGLILVKVNDFEGIKRHYRKNNNNMGEEQPVFLESIVFYILLITKMKIGGWI